MNSGLQSSGAPRYNLLPSVVKLLRLRLIIWTGSIRRASLRRKFGYLILALLLLAGLGFAFFISWQVLQFFQSPQLESLVGDTRALMNSIPVILVSAVFIGILLTSFGVLLQALYLAGDMDFLLSSPVPIRAVFLSKLLQAILPNFGIILIFALPVLYGLGIANGYYALYYPLVLVLLALMALTAAGLASLLVMLIVRIFPARRVAEVLGLVVGISSLLCSQSGQLANYGEVNPQQFSQALNSVSRFNTPWIPLNWAGRGLVAIGEKNWLVGLGLISLTILLGGVLFSLSLVASEKLYYSGWASLQVQSRRKKKGRDDRRAAVSPTRMDSWVNGLLSAPVAAIIRKDYLILRRDLRNLSQLITPLILGVIYTFMLLRGGGQTPMGRGEAPEWFIGIASNFILYANVGLALFVAWMLLSRLAIVSFSQEGLSYWVLKAAPISAGQMLVAKFLVAYLPSIMLSWAFLLVISAVRGTQVSITIYGLLAVAASIAGMAGLNLAFGVVGAKFDWDDPRRMSAGSSGCLGALTSVVYLVLSMALFFLPPVLTTSLGGTELVGQLIGFVLGLSFCAVCAYLPPYLVRHRVSRLMEA